MILALPLLPALLLAGGDLAMQDVRVAVIVGNNRGLDSEQPLEWAERDALRVHSLLTEIGGVAPRRAYLVLGGTADDVLHAIIQATGQLRELSAYTRTSLLFYVSAHADEEALHLGGERLALARLRGELARAPAQLRVVLVDACRTPVDARRKGGRPGPEVPVVFDQSARLDGEVLMSAAGPGELAQEWAHLRGSLFTHHLLAALRGAADYDGNGKVTLAEAYSYAYHVTLAKAAEAGLAPQRPSFEFALVGFGEWVFTRVEASGAQLALAEDLEGRVWITDRGRDIVAEIEKRGGERLRLAVAPGLYRVVVPKGPRAYVAEVSLAYGGSRTVAGGDLVRVPASRAAWKGGDDPLVLRPWDLSAGVAVSNGVLAGMSPRTGFEVGVARSVGDWVARAGAGMATASIRGGAADISHREARLALSLVWTRPAGIATVGLGIEARPAWVWQRIRRRDADQIARLFGTGTESASGASLALGPLATSSIPIGDRGRVSLDLGAGAEWLPDFGGTVRAHWFVQPRLSAAWSH